jgi:hypothetical protein
MIHIELFSAKIIMEKTKPCNPGLTVLGARRAFIEPAG